MNEVGIGMTWTLSTWLGMAIKGGVILAAAGVVSILLHRSSASYRHLAWMLALVSLPVVTVLSLIGPAWPVPVVPPAMSGVGVDVAMGPAVQAPMQPGRLPGGRDAGRAGMALPDSVPSLSSPAPAPEASSGRSWVSWLFVVWAASALVPCLPLALGLMALVRVRRTARTPDDGYWDELVTRCRHDLGLARPVRVLEHGIQSMPMTWGTFRPTVVLPLEARTWSPEKCRAVMLHELAHVQRFDYLTRMLARMGLALHLFNPLAWVAWRRMLSESERACDDRVLAAGADPAEYADHLIQIAQHCLASLGTSATAITMARTSQLEGRILAVLDVARNRAGVGRARLAVYLAMTVLVILPVSAIRLVARASEPEPMRHFVRLVVDGEGLRFQGEPVAWEALSDQLAVVSNRAHTVLELAVATEEISLRQWNQARARALELSRTHGFEYVSEIGLHAADSVGSPSEPRDLSEGALAERRDQAVEDGDLLDALGLEMQRVLGRAKSGHAYKDKISLVGVWEAYRDRQRPSVEQIRLRMDEVRQWGDAFADNAEYPWRRAQVLAAMAGDAGDLEEALTWMNQALDRYPEVPYADPSKHSKFQHLVNDRAGLRWEADGPGPATREALKQLRTDSRFEYFFVPWWENELERRGIEGIDEDIRPLKRMVLDVYEQRLTSFPGRADLTRGYMKTLALELEGGAGTGAPVTPASNALQAMIDQASPGDTVTVPPGTHTEPLVITKALTLQGADRSRAMLKVRADQPAIQVRTEKPVIIRDLTIEWQRASSRRPDGPLAALAAHDGPLVVENCEFSGDAGYERCPSAVVIDGFGDAELRGCLFSGFEYTVQVSGGANGLVEDCVFVKPGHCGLTAARGAVVTARRNLVTGSLFHGMRCTGGTLHAEDNLIIANKNRGIYLGNRAAHGLVQNNLILENATGISVFGGSDTEIRNNVFSANTFAAIDSRSLCPIQVHDNALVANNQGFVVWEETSAPATVQLGGNLFWRNASNDVLGIDLPAGAVMEPPGFADAGAGDFSRPAAVGPGASHGLARPQALRSTWEKWGAMAKLLGR